MPYTLLKITHHLGYQFDLGSQTPEEYLQWALQPKEIADDGAASEDLIRFNEVRTP